MPCAHSSRLRSRSHQRAFLIYEKAERKELVARALHAASLRSDQAFVKVNCAPSPRVDRVRAVSAHQGQLTGASENKIGKFEKGGAHCYTKSRT